MAGDKRRAHNKSRLGCKNCKGRKIKCDEQKPACANCLKRNDSCDFLGSESPQFAISPGGLNMTDLELLHNYTTTAHATLSTDPAIREFYRVSVVQVGFTCDYIMRALLAVSSLHLAHFRPHMREHYQSVAIVHYQAASRTAMPLIPDVSDDTAQLLFLFSVLTTYYTLGWPRDADDVLLLGDSGFPDWLFVLRGIRGILYVAGVPSEGPLSPIFKHSCSRFELRDAADSDAPALTPLRDLREAISRRALPDEQKRMYVTAIDELAKSFRHAQQSVSYDIIDANVWLFIVAEDLLPMLRVPTQEAVAIVAFYCALLRRLEDRWWLRGWPVNLIARAWGLLDEEWRLWVRWPVEEVGWVPPSAVV